MYTVALLLLSVSLAHCGPTYLRYFAVEKMETLVPADTLEEQPEKTNALDMMNFVPPKNTNTYRLSFGDYNQTWEEYKVTHKKQYDSKEEETRRFDIFMENVNLIEYHNWRFHNKKQSFWAGLNHFTDMTNEEYRVLNGFRNVKKTSSCDEYNPEATNVPQKIDWRNKGIVTPVKNQGRCGSCWSFSTTGAVEGQYAKVNNKLVSFSEQQLMDCSRDYGDMSCNGGLMDNAFEYIIDYGLETEAAYPYEAEDETCHYDKSRVVAHVKSCKDVTPKGDESALKVAVGNIGPVSVAINAGLPSFQVYAGGVYDEPDCKDQLDHGVLVVGYGSEEGKDYWLVKNSWGESWGLQGYIKMSRNKDNQCGIADSASFPTV